MTKETKYILYEEFAYSFRYLMCHDKEIIVEQKGLHVSRYPDRMLKLTGSLYVVSIFIPFKTPVLEIMLSYLS